MEITVKRRTWLLGLLNSLRLEFNGEKIGNIHFFQNKTIEIPEKEGRLKYVQILDHNDEIHVKDGDIIIIKENLISTSN
ncbi:hypothetical protein FO441_08780 [Salinicoccus cyprini]|uniref:Uncharacterized protein n=1 Tax=Salinicoccus cyprini TaxID=2493691 RepID=A0A558AU41_9STAP|nr:hypothetical protein [Salinicoccus cyprini]TVT27790.1 hypothetical protein FO441_08780 [Salinicoccus cyprini]